MQKTYLYLMVCVIGAMSLASCSEDSISPDAGGDGDSTTEVPSRLLSRMELSISIFPSVR